jgi:hypothetical protein
MTNLKDQIQQEIRKERESSERPVQAKRRGARDASIRLDEIRPRLDELPHTTDKYSLKTHRRLAGQPQTGKLPVNHTEPRLIMSGFETPTTYSSIWRLPLRNGSSRWRRTKFEKGIAR